MPAHVLLALFVEIQRNPPFHRQISAAAALRLSVQHHFRSPCKILPEVGLQLLRTKWTTCAAGPDYTKEAQADRAKPCKVVVCFTGFSSFATCVWKHIEAHTQTLLHICASYDIEHPRETGSN